MTIKISLFFIFISLLLDCTKQKTFNKEVLSKIKGNEKDSDSIKDKNFINSNYTLVYLFDSLGTVNVYSIDRDQKTIMVIDSIELTDVVNCKLEKNIKSESHIENDSLLILKIHYRGGTGISISMYEIFILQKDGKIIKSDLIHRYEEDVFQDIGVNVIDRNYYEFQFNHELNSIVYKEKSLDKYYQYTLPIFFKDTRFKLDIDKLSHIYSKEKIQEICKNENIKKTL